MAALGKGEQHLRLRSGEEPKDGGSRKVKRFHGTQSSALQF